MAGRIGAAAIYNDSSLQMLSENDKQNLLRNLARGRVVLVTGAGFSADAMNISGGPLPVGNQLAKSLWKFLYETEYDGKPI